MSAPRTFIYDATSKTIYVTLYDSTTFLPKTGLVFNSAGATASYCRAEAARAAITLASRAVTGGFETGGFVEVDATNMPGVYRFDVPNAAFASGVKEVTLSLKFTGVVSDHTLCYLTAYDPNAAGADIATIADGVWNEERAGHVAAGSFGEYVLADAQLISADATAANNLEAMLDGTGSVTLSAILGADAIPATALATGAITAAKFAAGAIDAAAVADGAIDAATFAAGAIDAAAIAANAIGASELAADAANEIADALLARNIAGGSSTGRIVSQALYALRNKTTITGGTLTVYATDDSTSSWTAAYTTAARDPIDGVDPA